MGKGYDDLEISNGSQASDEFKRVTFGDNITSSDRAKVRRDLTAYCGLDTMGTVNIVRQLGEVTSKHIPVYRPRND